MLDTQGPLKSMCCRYEHFLTPWYARWAARMGFPTPVTLDLNYSYRKIWEWAAIMQALDERDMLRGGRRGVGFAVGTESLPSIFASLGAEILATDLPDEQSDGHWDYGNQHSSNVEALFFANHVAKAEFDRLVRFQPVNMLDLSGLPDESFDFAWSSCAMEHLGRLEAGLDFVRNAMRIIKPGGVAVHTTEFNCSSNDQTITEGWNVVYRQRDMEELDRSLRPMRCGLEAFDFDAGTHPLDLAFDPEPYFQGTERHIKLQFGPFIATSFMLIARKG